jgi:tetrahydromethanopterin S-methyltransferase subunit F
MENRGQRMKKFYLTDFVKGVITGMLVAIVFFGIIAAFTYFNKKTRS